MNSRRFIRRLWRWSLLITLPLIFCFTLWAQSTIRQYYNFGIRFGSLSSQITLNEIGRMESSFLLRRMLRPLYREDPLRGRPLRGIDTINLFIKEDKLRKLGYRLPYSGFDYKKARMFYGGKLRPVKLKYRGDNIYHWAFPRKSFRIRTRETDKYKGMRDFNLVLPKMHSQINGYFSYRLAELMGLLVPHAELVNVTLNGQYEGLYMLVEQLGEETLRDNSLMPGDIYSGEILGRDRYIGATDNLFFSHSIWEKVSYNNHYERESREPLKKLISLMSVEQTPETAAELSGLLDMRQWGRFSAFETLNDDFHYDSRHNWRIYYDPARGKFVPIIWDPLGWPRKIVERSYTDVINSKLHYSLFQNADFLRERNRAFEEFFRNSIDEKLLREMDELKESIVRSIESTSFLVISERRQGQYDAELEKLTWIWPVYPFRSAGGDEVADAALDLVGTVRAEFDRFRSIFAGSSSLKYWQAGSRVKLELSGRTNLDAIRLDFDRAQPNGLKAVVRYWFKGEPVEVDVSGAVTLPDQADRGNVLVRTELLSDYLLMQTREEQAVISVRPAYYELEFKGLASGSSLEGVRAVYSNGSKVDAVESRDIMHGNILSMQLAVKPAPLQAPVVWEGEKSVSGFTVLDRDLFIRAGTTVKMAPGAVLVLRGRLLAEGTPERPVKFMPSEAGSPWGAVVLKGQAAGGSSIRGCRFSGGSGYKDVMSEYSAMLSIHDAGKVLIDECLFEDNHEVDDMVHVVYSDVTIRRSEFRRARADCLDLDISGAVISDSRFSECGNDAVDLMTSRLSISNSVMSGNGDKGMSVGEKSAVLALNCTVQRSGIGVQVKDGSVATLYNMDLLDNRLALDAYHKNLQYDSGGTLYMYKGRLRGNLKLAGADKASSVSIYDSYADGLPSPSDRIHIDGTVDDESQTIAGESEFRRLPEEMKALDERGRFDWDGADPRRRGALVQ